MLSIRESGSFDIERRVLLLAVDDNDRCENALGWLLDNLYRWGDTPLGQAMSRAAAAATFTPVCCWL